MVGVRKTALAVYWVHQVADRFPDGQLYVNLRGDPTCAVMDPAEGVRRFLDALQVGPGGTALTASAREWASGGRRSTSVCGHDVDPAVTGKKLLVASGR